MIRQSTFIIPPDIEAGLLAGELIKHGGIVRTTTGQIYKHLKEIDLPRNSESASARAVAVIKNPKVVIVSVVVATVAVGGAAVAVTRMRKRPAIPECVSEYKDSLSTYPDAVREGRLNSIIIDRLIAALDTVVAYAAEDDSLTIDLSPQQAAMLVRVVVDSTEQLADENSIDLTRFQEHVPTSEDDDVIIDLRRHLEVQKRIFADAG